MFGTPDGILSVLSQVAVRKVKSTAGLAVEVVFIVDTLHPIWYALVSVTPPHIATDA